MAGLGRALILFGIVLVIAGLLVSLAGRLPWIGRLPGDIYIRRDSFSFYLPLTSGVLVSLVLSALFYLLRR